MADGKETRLRICLDCAMMQHFRYDWECGRCEYDGHLIDHIKNHDSCDRWIRAFYDDALDEDEDSESFDSLDI